MQKITRVVPYSGKDPRTYRYKVINQYGGVKTGPVRPTLQNATDEVHAKFPKAIYIEIQSRIVGRYSTHVIIKE